MVPVSSQGVDSERIKMRVLLLKEETTWVAQCLEYDIAAQGPTVALAKEAFVHAFTSQIAVALHHGEEPLATFGRAPKRYWDLLSEAERLAEPIRISDASTIPPSFMINAMQKTLAESWISV